MIRSVTLLATCTLCAVAAANERVNPLTAVPPSPSVLSVLRNRDGHREWVRMDPAKHLSATVAELPPACKAANVISWSHDWTKAIAWSTGGDEEHPPACEVTIATGHVRVLPAFSEGGEFRLGYDKADRIHLVTVLSSPEENANHELVYRGVAYKALDLDGSPELVLDFRLEKSGQWKFVHADPSTGEACDTPGISEGQILGEFGASAHTNDTGRFDAESSEQIPPATLALLAKTTPKDPNQEEADLWRALNTDPPTAFVRGMDDADPYWVESARVVVIQGKAAKPLPVDVEKPWTQSTRIEANGPYVLIEAATTHMFDVRTLREVLKTNDNVALWPEDR